MKKSRLISLLLAAIILISCFAFNLNSQQAVASDEIVTATGDDFAYSKLPYDNPTYIALGQYLGTDTKIRIPEKIEGLPVTEIWSSSFSGNESIKYVEIPATVETVAGRSFNLCSSLTEIAVSPQNPYLASKDGILYNKDITTVLAFPTGIGGEFIIPESVVSVAPYAFESCYNLTSVKMYNNVYSIGQSAFAFCWNLRSIKLSDNLKTLGFKALAYCDSLLEIHLPASLKLIGTDALVGNIDSNGNLVYNFINGLYYVKGTYSEKYVKKLHLTPGYTFAEPRTVTDIDSNVTLYDSEGALPEKGNLDLNVNVLKNSDYAKLLPVRHADMEVNQVSLTVDGKVTQLSKATIIRFNNMKSAIPTATKIYVSRGSKLVEQVRAPQAAFVGTTFTESDTFVVITNNDFSLKGDIDGDGTRSIYDVRFALCLSAGLVPTNGGLVTQAQLKTANIDGVAGIKTEDAREILKYAAGIKK